MRLDVIDGHACFASEIPCPALREYVLHTTGSASLREAPTPWGGIGARLDAASVFLVLSPNWCTSMRVVFVVRVLLSSLLITLRTVRLLRFMRIQDASASRNYFKGVAFLAVYLIVLLIIAIFADGTSIEGASKILVEIF
jgi:hypothetical protein